jgi:hypothetical protein
MLIDVLRAIVPLMVALFQVASVALAIGMLPALWIMARGRHYRLLMRWGIMTLLFAAAAIYGLPKAHESWWWWVTIGGKNPALFRSVALWLGYFIGVLFAPMLIPEPLRLVRRRIRHERPRPEEHTRKVRRRRRRTEGYGRDVRFR